MKKLIISIVAAALMSLGLIGTTTTSADAVTCPYSGCVGTKTHVRTPRTVVKGSHILVNVRVSPRSGTGHPHGTIRVSCHRHGKTKTKVRHYSHARSVGFVLGKRGKWTCTAHFTSARKWRASTGRDTTRVTRR